MNLKRTKLQLGLGLMACGFGLFVAACLGEDVVTRRELGGALVATQIAADGRGGIAFPDRVDDREGIFDPRFVGEIER